MIWLGIIKNAQVAFPGSNKSNFNITVTEMYLEYIDGSAYTAIGGVQYETHGHSQSTCFDSKDPYTFWDDRSCSNSRVVLCEYDCDNVNV